MPLIGEAVHTETNEVLVLDEPFNGDLEKMILHARPKKMFLEQIVHEGRHVLRFEYQG